jgi:hypothetical protein
MIILILLGFGLKINKHRWQYQGPPSHLGKVSGKVKSLHMLLSPGEFASREVIVKITNKATVCCHAFLGYSIFE